ncbi:putative aldo/keto reductase [Colletotrichum truncatum]|uniref:Aldo/keto reductase n=1 Tax=Colletotrichum truncatum TaxID=5467 RepID=A0ACC3YZG6_COLTU|nr:putative aldo/keto reductase [Colletotrichum truncatum]KAF6790826.1 putative aldo/keto reductase [Colletotrichum truncatum]
MGHLSLLLSSLLIPLALGAPAGGAQQSNLARDLKIVQTFKQKVTVDPKGITKKWVGNDICKFEGFRCAENPNTKQTAVSGIDFNDFNFGKDLSLNGFVDQLTDLTFFHAGSNDFTGSIPDFSKSKWLWELDLSDNKFSGPFPPTILNMDLVFLSLRFNQFSGPLPPKLFDLDLDTIFLNNNKFNGQIPDNLGSSPARYIVLANNQFTGPIPKSVATSKDINEILFLGNQLTGPLPTTFNLPNATIFDVSDNKLSGPVPESLCQQKKLQALNLSKNRFTGKLGPACTALVNKKILDVTGNCLEGVKGQKAKC